MVKRTAWFIWELPQNLLGIFLRRYYKEEIISIEIIHERKFLKVKNFGISLGSYIFWSEIGGRNNKQHEFGHSIQSKILGPSYLILVGIPSFLRAVYSRYYFKKYNRIWNNYFTRYPESWADTLGTEFFPESQLQ